MKTLTIPIKRFNSYTISSIFTCLFFFIAALAISTISDNTILFGIISLLPLYFAYQYGSYLFTPIDTELELQFEFDENGITIIKQDVFVRQVARYWNITNTKSYLDRLTIYIESDAYGKDSIECNCKNPTQWEKKIREEVEKHTGKKLVEN